jgi:hypothetical protein
VGGALGEVNRDDPSHAIVVDEHTVELAVEFPALMPPQAALARSPARPC